nr:cell division cycle-associated 7-like protein [Ipomoea batatas]
MDRMKKLGLPELSKKLKPEIPNPKGSDKHKPPSHKKRPLLMNPLDAPLERREASKGGKVAKDVEICIPEGEKPELYTKEHERVLGDSKNSWSLYEDGYDEDGQRIYDPDFGKSCHQCRYGENVIEVNENTSWICPVCRDICNCSRCRRVKGWAPTGAIYRKVLSLGYKSVAHYLIMNYMQREKEEEGDENHHPPSIKSSEPSDDDLADVIVVSDESNEVLEKQKQQLDDDEEEEEEEEAGSHESEDDEDANASADDSE